MILQFLFGGAVCAISALLRHLIFSHSQRTGQLLQVPLISIIEDDECVRVATRSFVRSLGFAACAFASAEEFLQSPELGEMSCVISDVQMPGIGGLELQSRLASRHRRTPVIFITAFPDPRIEERALAGGAICFLTKPFDGKTLIQCVDRALNRSNS
jgi:FixJ family two-component response regulator